LYFVRWSMLYYTFCYNDCMPEVSVGILIYRWRKKVLEVFLIHPGGPFWKNKDAGAWSIPKGILDPGEDPLEGAQREFYEETGFDVPGDLIPLAAVKAYAGKTIRAWAGEGDYDPGKIRSNVFSMEWPPHSGTRREFPEIDRAAWFGIEEAHEKMHRGQVPLLDELVGILSRDRRR
jgi:predicted NUDIX family NTP pyrophosphohydrolase